MTVHLSKKRSYMTGEARREQILKAAIVVFAKYGYQRASIDLVCAEAKIARGTLYQYFEDKESLFRTILKEYAEKIQSLMQPAPLSLLMPLKDSKQALMVLLGTRIHQILSLFQQDRDMFIILFTEALSKSAETEGLEKEINQKFIRLMVKEMKIAQKAGIGEIRNPELLANFIVGGLAKVAQEYILEATKPMDTLALAQEVTLLLAKLLLNNG